MLLIVNFSSNLLASLAIFEKSFLSKRNFWKNHNLLRGRRRVLASRGALASMHWCCCMIVTAFLSALWFSSVMSASVENQAATVELSEKEAASSLRGRFFFSYLRTHRIQSWKNPSICWLDEEEFCHLSNLSFFPFPLESPQLGIVGVLFALLYNRMEDDLPILMHSV